MFPVGHTRGATHTHVKEDQPWPNSDSLVFASKLESRALMSVSPYEPCFPNQI